MKFEKSKYITPTIALCAVEVEDIVRTSVEYKEAGEGDFGEW